MKSQVVYWTTKGSQHTTVNTENKSTLLMCITLHENTSIKPAYNMVANIMHTTEYQRKRHITPCNAFILRLSAINLTNFITSICKPHVPLPSCHFQALDKLFDFPDLHISVGRTFFWIIVGGRHLKVTVLLPSGNNPQQYFQINSEGSLLNPCQNGAEEKPSCPTGATQSPMSNRFSNLPTKSGNIRIVRCVLEI